MASTEFCEAETKLLEEMKEVSADIESFSKMRKIFLDTNKGIEGFMEELQEIKLSNENHLDIIDQKIKWLKKRMSLLLQEEGETQDADDQLETATEVTSIGPVVDETEEVLEKAQEKVKRIKELLQEKERDKADITKEILQMKRRLKTVAEEVEKTFGRDPAEEEGPSFAVKVIGGKKRVVVAEDVKKAFWRYPAEEEEPRCAVKVIGGKQMVAPVRVKPRNQVRLSHFAEGDVPQKSLIVEHEALMKTSSRRAFLDLALGETPLGRVVIKVMDEGNLALNFLHVCAGDLGPSYANSQLSGVRCKGQAGECTYVNTHRNSVIEVDWEKEKQREIYKRTPWKAGEVRGYFSDDSASSFAIITRTHRILPFGNCFGIVEEGLDVLRDAISQCPDISAVRIVDCGLMFPL